MKRERLPFFGPVLVAAVLAAAPNTQKAPPGVVVEKAVPAFEAAKAGIRPGDILLSWERAANPPANPAAASGVLRSPFDLQEIYVDQAPRAKTLTLIGTREGKRFTASIANYPWRLETRPPFSERWLPRYEEGRRLMEQGDLAKGSDIWRALAADLSAADQRVDAIWLWLRTGIRQSEAKQPDAAVAAIDQALREAAGRPEIEAQLWGYKVEVLRAANRDKDAEGAARQALAIRESAGTDTLAVSYCLHEQASVMRDEAPEYQAINRRALRIREKLAPGSRNEAASLMNLSRFAGKHGDSRSAIDLLRRALAINQGLEPASRTVATIYSNLCAHEMNAGELAAAENDCRRSLAILRAIGPAENAGIAQVLHNMGVVARLLGDLDRSVQLFRQALEACDQYDPAGKLAGWNTFELGVDEVERRNLDQAEDDFRRAESIFARVEAEGSPYAALIALLRADIAYLRGDLAGSEKLLREARAFYDRTAPEGPAATAVLDSLGRVLGERGSTREAETLIRRALVLRQGIGPGSQETAESRHNLGMLLWKTGRVAEAEVELRRAIDDIEAQRGKLGDSEQSGSVFAARFGDYYKDYVNLLVELHREQDAFLTLERFRAGAFLRTLAQRDLAPPGEVPDELDRERRLTNAEYERAQADIRAMSRKDDAKKIEEGLMRLAELRQKQAEIAERIKRASPRYGALRYPQALDLASARAALDPETLLLSYSVGKEKSFLFVVSSDPRRGRPLSVFALPVGEISLRESVDAFRRLIDRNDASPELFARSHSLFDALIRPAGGLIGKHGRLLILPDGPLHKLPWAALVRSVRAEDPQYLVEWKPVHTALSATVYAELRKSRRGVFREPDVEVAAFGDPLYPAPIARKAAVTRSDGTDGEEESYGDAQLDAVLRGGYRFQPLPGTRQEVQTIAGLYAPRSESYVGAEATEERARGIGKDVPLIHYACHAYVNERFPLDSALVFTIPENPATGQDNGLLQAWEIIENVRIDADLVTLSGCDSGLGKEMGGEGLIGLTRAFQYAGARSVLASLWKVEDAATAELMKRFYGYLRAGLTKDEALRLAQMDLIRAPKFSRPRDWAAFEIIGDWK